MSVSKRKLGGAQHRTSRVFEVTGIVLVVLVVAAMAAILIGVIVVWIGK